jgi:indoleacetamide hydrolase
MNRRAVLKVLVAASLSELTSSAPSCAEDDILELDCTALLVRIRDGTLKAEQVCASFLKQYERERSLNVVTWINPTQVLSSAREIDQLRHKGRPLPPLAGLPILVKDNIDTVGFPTSAGTASLRRHFPTRDARIVGHLLRQGALLMGKANMHELAAGPTSSNPTFGFVRNPYNPAYIPGGSSGGCAAAIAARIVPVALGTDTAGSVRIPAAYCGIVGFRPSTYPRPLYSQEGVVPLSLNLDTIGPMGRSVADIALMHSAIVGRPPARAPILAATRIGIPRGTYWDDLHPEVEHITRAALTRLRDQGATLVEIDLRKIYENAKQIFSALGSRKISDLESFLRTQVPSISVHELMQQITSRDVRAWVEKAVLEQERESALPNSRGIGRDTLCTAYRNLFREHGIQAVVSPTQVFPPPPIRDCGDDPDETIELNGRMVPKVETIFRNTVPTVGLGAPTLSLPAGLTESGLPVGLQFEGLPGGDTALLGLARSAEAAIGRLAAPRLG